MKKEEKRYSIPYILAQITFMLFISAGAYMCTQNACRNKIIEVEKNMLPPWIFEKADEGTSSNIDYKKFYNSKLELITNSIPLIDFDKINNNTSLGNKIYFNYKE